MRAWTSPHLPSLPGRGPQVHLYDTSAGAVRATTPGPTASLYVCGITPYDATHLGHAATYVAFDTLNRAWRDAGHDVRYVQNITDVDDPLLERAAKTGQDWRELAHEQTQLFREDMQWLRVLAPQHYMGAVETIPLVVELIAQLEEASAVYEVDGDLYFSVRSDADFGAVAGLDDDTMRSLFAERGGDPDRPGKKDPLDCLLWQAARPGEPSWRSRFGPGRPGWHIECTAIALRYLGDPFDVQGGGRDLAFPHHEMSASESHVATGRRPFARAYVHAGMVGLDGQKMSKSLGNLVFASALRADGRDPAAVRLALLGDHYRSDRDWTGAHLDLAEERLARWRAATSAATGPDAEAVLAAVRRSLADDLDTPGAIAAIDAWVEQTLGAAATPAAPTGSALPAAPTGSALPGATGPSAPSAASSPGLVRTIADTLLGISL